MRQAAATVVAVAALWGVVSAPTARAGTTAVAAARPAGGAVMVGWHEDGDDVAGLRAHEAELGTRFGLVRMYQQWQVPSKRVTGMADGRLVLVSHKPPAGGWAAVASGAEDPMIVQLADSYRALGREVLFTFHHEPHDDASDVKGGTAGTAAEYRAAWRRIRTIFDQRGASHSVGGNVFFAYVPVGSWARKAVPGGAPGSGDALYPGDDLIDVLAPDAYNWGACRNDAWEEFSTEWAPLVALAAAHHKPLIAAEFGSAPGDRDDWFRHAATWMRTDPLARQWLWGFAYFHSLHDTCPWDFLNQSDGRAGWQDAFRDPYFTGTPFSLASAVLPAAGGPAPPSPAPPSAPVVRAAAPTAKPTAGAPTPVHPVSPTPTTSATPATPVPVPDPGGTPAPHPTMTAPPSPAPSPAPVPPTAPSTAGPAAAPPGTDPAAAAAAGPVLPPRTTGRHREDRALLMTGGLMAVALVFRRLVQ